MAYSYLSLTDFQARIESTSPTTADNARHRAVLEAATRAVDNYTARRFQPYTATLYYQALSSYRIDIDDLLSITTLKTDANNDGTYERTWDSDDYDLLPYNAQARREPYTAIEITDTGLGNETFPTTKKSTEIAGVWGYWLETADTGTTVNGSHDSTTTTLAVADGDAIEVLDTLLIGSEAFYVTAKATNNLTVERGANGTTAASLSGSESISVYRYPEPVVEATFLQANRIHMLKAAPFGVIGGPDVGQSRIPRVLPDVQMLLDQYRQQMVWAI